MASFPFVKGNERFCHPCTFLSQGQITGFKASSPNVSPKISLYWGNEALRQPGSGMWADKTDLTSLCCHWACCPLIIWILEASCEGQGEDVLLILNSHPSQYHSPECHGNWSNSCLKTGSSSELWDKPKKDANYQHHQALQSHLAVAVMKEKHKHWGSPLLA